MRSYPLLRHIDSPADLRRLGPGELAQLAAELRDYLIVTVANTGGHLAAGLGTIELTIALHYVFNTPSDRLVWDIGHQAYPHKILTAAKANTTPSAPVIPAPRSAPPWAWRWPRRGTARAARPSPSSATVP
jgi:deoxyxylulose-5-phosphate synthase